MEPEFIRNAKNVLGGSLQTCCMNPLTGFFRNGRCDTNVQDHGSHTICVELSQAFLIYSKQEGNDLSTPRPEFQFPGLKPGDKWCLCASRWLDAYSAGFAPPVLLECTHERALDIINLELLKERAS